MSDGKKYNTELDNFTPSQCKNKNRVTGTGGISIVDSSNGKRVRFNASMLSNFSSQTTIQVAYSENLLAIASNLGNSHTNYKLSKSGKNGVIYNAALVKEIVEKFELDFTNRTSRTFPIFDIQEKDNELIVYINMKSSE